MNGGVDNKSIVIDSECQRGRNLKVILICFWKSKVFFSSFSVVFFILFSWNGVEDGNGKVLFWRYTGGILLAMWHQHNGHGMREQGIA
jgi:hypothetical protein